MVIPKLLQYKNYHQFCMENALVIHYYNLKRVLNYTEPKFIIKISKNCIFKFAFEKNKFTIFLKELNPASLHAT